MNNDYYTAKPKHSDNPCIANVPCEAMQNRNYRCTLWTGCHLQMTLMCIPVCSDIGLEIHPDTDQIIRIEEGMAHVLMGCSQTQLNFHRNVCAGDTVFVPAGTWHNVINTGRTALKVSAIYAPPQHPAGTIHQTKADAEKEHY